MRNGLARLQVQSKLGAALGDMVRHVGGKRGDAGRAMIAAAVEHVRHAVVEVDSTEQDCSIDDDPTTTRDRFVASVRQAHLDVAGRSFPSETVLRGFLLVCQAQAAGRALRDAECHMVQGVSTWVWRDLQALKPTPRVVCTCAAPVVGTYLSDRRGSFCRTCGMDVVAA